MAEIEANLQQRLAQLDELYQQLNREVRSWGQESKQALLFAVSSLNLKERIALDGEVKLINSIGFKIKRSRGRVEAVTFQFERKGVFLERGVGLGRPVGSAKAEAVKRPWLEPTLTPRVEKLADILMEKYADIIADTLKISIPGILQMKVTKG